MNNHKKKVTKRSHLSVEWDFLTKLHQVRKNNLKDKYLTIMSEEVRGDVELSRKSKT